MSGYIKIGDIKGECTEKDHKEWIELASWSWSVSKEMTYKQNKPAPGSTHVNDLTISKNCDLASPLLMKACCDGTYFKEVELHLTKDTGKREKYLVYKLENAFLSSYDIGGGGEEPNDSFTLSYHKVTFEYTQYDDAGKKKGNNSGAYSVSERTAE